MARLKLWNGEDIGEQGNQIMKETSERWGEVPNIVKALALNKDVLIGEDIWTDRLMKKGLLSRKFKEMIATTVSATNKCYYCTSAHAWAMEYTGTSKQLTDRITVLDFNLFESKEQVALEFVRKATINSKSITQKDIDQMKKYYSDAEIVEICAVIMAYQGYNTFVEILGLEIDSKMQRGLPQTWA